MWGQDNYTAAVGKGEVITGEERRETIDFIEALMITPCMRYAHQYLVKAGVAPESETAFKVLPEKLAPTVCRSSSCFYAL